MSIAAFSCDPISSHPIAQSLSMGFKREHELAGTANQMRRDLRRHGAIAAGLLYAAGQTLFLSWQLDFQTTARMCRQTCAWIANGRGISAAAYTENREAVFGIVLEIRRFT